MCRSVFITISLRARAGIEKVSQRVMARRQSLRHGANSNYLLNWDCFARSPLTFAAAAVLHARFTIGGLRRSERLHAFRAEREKNLPAIDQSIEYLAVAHILHHFPPSISLALLGSILSIHSDFTQLSIGAWFSIFTFDWHNRRFYRAHLNVDVFVRGGKHNMCVSCAQFT